MDHRSVRKLQRVPLDGLRSEAHGAEYGALELPHDAEPPGLSDAGHEAYRVIRRLAQRHKLSHPSNRVYHTPEYWRSRGWDTSGELVLHLEGSDIQLLWESTPALAEKANAALEAVGLYFESCTLAWGAVYKIEAPEIDEDHAVLRGSSACPHCGETDRSNCGGV